MKKGLMLFPAPMVRQARAIARHDGRRLPSTAAHGRERNALLPETNVLKGSQGYAMMYTPSFVQLKGSIMSSDDRDIDQVPPDISPRRSRTERLTSSGEASDEPINPGWRTGRTANTRRRSASVPASSQEFALWLQHGGWRFLVAALALVVIFVALMIFNQPPSTQQTSNVLATRAPLSLQTVAPTVSAATGAGAGSIPIVPTPPVSTTTTLQARFRVTGTGVEGLFLRPQPSSDGAPIKTLPEGVEVTIIGEDQVKADRVWKHVRDDAGAEGWAAADFLQAVGP